MVYVRKCHATFSPLPVLICSHCIYHDFNGAFFVKGNFLLCLDSTNHDYTLILILLIKLTVIQLADGGHSSWGGPIGSNFWEGSLLLLPFISTVEATKNTNPSGGLSLTKIGIP